MKESLPKGAGNGPAAKTPLDATTISRRGLIAATAAFR